ncbi:hypothetical protein N7510_009053 [Penicillium lagena]|uniref:uncharacterized protein n=1 Tax=Penicillium lagena TaxID=94218 RepID=UPI00253FCE84|nr:uncharacterized protein N7510_009053 [Penicillium lagena]KAJ5606272.1 hypothetical protein N7510_009053 [Penicillium lagena]
MAAIKAFVVFSTLISLHLLVAPYTKVEESFHIQAVHDIFINGLPSFPGFGYDGGNNTNIATDAYDHFQFPGAVPRTAIGAAVLAKLLSVVPESWVVNGADQQFLARLILGLFNALSLAVYTHGLRRSYGRVVATWYMALQASQFHLIFYASRPLSNTFAFGLTTLAMRFLLPSAGGSAPPPRSSSRLALFLLTVAGVIFRSELALLVAAQTVFMLITDQISLIPDAIPAGLAGLVVGVGASVAVDSAFWQRLVWPELNAFLFNVVSGQSSKWGTQPFYFYLFALMRLLLNPLTYLLAIPVSLRQPATKRSATALLVPSLVFVVMYSAQPHKEWRFIVYAVPPLTASAALGAAYLWNHQTRSWFNRIAAWAMVAATVASLCISTFILLPASAVNYPGGYALRLLHESQENSTSSGNATVYLGNLACQTGATRFLQRPDWIYDKTEDSSAKSTPAFWDTFDYILVEASSDESYRDADETLLRAALPSAQWDTVAVAEGFAGVELLRPEDLAEGAVEGRVLRDLLGESAVVVYEILREMARTMVLWGWWVELKVRPRVKVLMRVR